MLKRTLFISSLLLLFFCHFVFPQNNNTKRIALVIGVKSYEFVSPLQNTLNDARDISAALKEKGFQVIELIDPRTKRQMQEAVIRYFELLQSDKNSSGLVFYSGHGMQVEGINYLIPTAANPQIKADIDDQCLSMDYVMSAIEQAKNHLNIFILDACRNNPFKSFYRSTEKGLSMVSSPKGSYIVYATKPGSVASDGNGRNGLFTSKLLNTMNIPGLNIEQVFKRVAAEVSNASGDAQRPWIASDYTGDFYFTFSENSSPGIPLQPHTTLPGLIINDDFSNNNQKWFEEDTDKFAFKVADGKYRIESKKGGSWWSTIPVIFNNEKDFEIAATIKKTSGTDGYYFGIVLGLDPITKYYHFMGITGWGDHTFANKGPAPKDLIIGNTNTLVQKGNSTNYILLKKVSNTYKFYINGNFIGETSYQQFFGDNFGFQLWSGNEKLSIEIDNISIKGSK